jgi:hypothetical protein
MNWGLRSDFVVHGASRRQSEHRASRPVKLNGIALILIVGVAIGLLACAMLGLVGLPCPNAYRTWLHESLNVDNELIGKVTISAPRLRVLTSQVWAGMRARSGTALSY